MEERLLIISHNIIDESNNVGKTVISLLAKWPSKNVYSIYLRNEVLETMFPQESFMISDKDVLNPTLKRSKECGRIIPTHPNETKSENKKAYRFGNKRYPIVSLVRDDIWHLGKWKTEALSKWVKHINPDIILFIPNDYILAFEIAVYVKTITHKPMVTFFTDDAFYFGQRIIGIELLRRKRLRKIGEKIVKASKQIFVASDLMRKEYRKYFSKDSILIGNCVELSKLDSIKTFQNRELVFSYIGNLHSNRWKNLIDIGMTLDEISGHTVEKAVINIYTASDLSKDILKKIQSVSSLNMKGSIRPNAVRKIQETSDALLHIEAFDEKSKRSTRLSMSTKIYEYMARNIPIFAYGPDDISSIQFLQDNNFAKVCTTKSNLKEDLMSFLQNAQHRKNTAIKAYDYAKEHFEREHITEVFCSSLIKATKNKDNSDGMIQCI